MKHTEADWDLTTLITTSHNPIVKSISVVNWSRSGLDSTLVSWRGCYYRGLCLGLLITGAPPADVRGGWWQTSEHWPGASRGWSCSAVQRLLRGCERPGPIPAMSRPFITIHGLSQLNIKQKCIHTTFYILAAHSFSGISVWCSSRKECDVPSSFGLEIKQTISF